VDHQVRFPARLVSVFSRLRRMGRSRACRCGHPHAAHQHFHRRTYCSLCDCPRWSAGWFRGPRQPDRLRRDPGAQLEYRDVREPLLKSLSQVKLRPGKWHARRRGDDTKLRVDTAEESDGILTLDHQQRPVAPVPPRYSGRAAAAARRPASP